MWVHIPFVDTAKCETVRVDIVGSSYVAYVIAPAKKDPQLIDLRKKGRGTQQEKECDYDFSHHKK